MPDAARPDDVGNLTQEEIVEVDRQKAELRKRFRGSEEEIALRTPFFKEFFGDWEESGGSPARTNNEEYSSGYPRPTCHAPEFQGVTHNIQPNSGNINPVSVVPEEPERSDGNRLYGSCADKKAVGSKSITAFYDNKKSRNLLRPRLLFFLVAGAGIEPTAFRL